MAIFTLEEFRKFRDYYYRKTGTYFEDSRFDFVERRIADRMEINGITRFRSYFAHLRLDFDGDELQKLTNLLTVNETYFYREEYQFQCLVNSALDEVIRNKRQGDNIRIWSVPCSTGEEPYSIALYLLEHWPPIEQIDVELHASDINTDVVSAAQRGLYGKRAVQYLPKPILEHYFSKKIKRGEELWQISKDLRQAVDFSIVNLFELENNKSMRHFDVIFCRNVLIYFDEVSRRKVAESLYDALNPGGFVMLGHSESMSRISSLFNIRRFKDAIIYQKPL
ncbi:CheR family methyltransferase [Magnetococcales bacterium HHB-1]